MFAKEVMFEEAARVPFLIRLPGQKRSKLIPQPVSHIDLVPTLLDLLGQFATANPSCGGPKHPQCAGKSLLPVIHEEALPPESIFIEWAPNRTKVKKGTSLAPRRMVKRAIDESTRTVVSSDGWKLCLRDKDLNELYNLKRRSVGDQQPLRGSRICIGDFTLHRRDSQVAGIQSHDKLKI